MCLRFTSLLPNGLSQLAHALLRQPGSAVAGVKFPVFTSPASAGLRALSAGVHVRAGAAGWSRWVAERSATDATLWFLTHHDCTQAVTRD
jgi:hypothetical protein